MPVKTFLSTPAVSGRFEAHQNLLASGKLVQVSPDMVHDVIFVSHEWLGWNHADPNGEQFQALTRILQRLMRSEVPKVESFYLQQLVQKQNTVGVEGFIIKNIMRVIGLGHPPTHKDNACYFIA